MNIKTYKFLFALLASTLLLASCGSSSSDSDDIDVKDLHGLWEANFLPGCEVEECEPDYTHVFLDKDKDTAYFLFYLDSPPLKSTLPSVIEWTACYELVSEEEWELDGNELIITDSNEDGDSQYEIELEDDVLTLDDGEDTFEFEFISNDIADEEICSDEV